MPNSARSTLLALCLVFLVTADGRTMRAHFDNVTINNTTSSATALLDSATDSNDVEGLIKLIKVFPVLTGERFPYFTSDPCYPQKLIWIECRNDDVRRVTALYLGAQNLYGTLPDFSSMDALEKIDLQRNVLMGYIPEFLGTFPELTYLDLSNNYFTGPLPDSLANNKKIKLNLAGNPLQLPPPAATLLPPPAATTHQFPPPTPTAEFPPPSQPLQFQYPLPPTPRVEYPFPLPPPVESRFPVAAGSGGGGGPGGGSGGFEMPNIGKMKKSKLPRILKITIPTGFFTMLITSCGIWHCCRRDRSDAAAVHTGVAAQ